MKSKVTDKFQITIPKSIRDKLNILKNDIIEWDVKKGYIIIKPARNPLESLKGRINVGHGNIRDDIKESRILRAQQIHEKNNN